MSRKAKQVKNALCIAALACGVLLIGTGGSTKTANAEGGPQDTQNVYMKIELSGTILALAPDGIVLTDGTLVKTTPFTYNSVPLQPNQPVKIVGELQGDNIVALSILAPDAVIIPTPIPTFTPTPEPAVVVALSPTPEPAAIACRNPQEQPVAERVAATFDVTYDEIENWHCRGFGYGEIVQAYVLANTDNVTLTVEQIFALRLNKQGWGEIIKISGVRVEDNDPAKVVKLKGKGEGNPNKGNKGKGKGNDKGKGNGNGNGNGKDHKGGDD